MIMAAVELPFLTVAEAKEHAKATRREHTCIVDEATFRTDPIVFTCLDAPGLYLGERSTGLEYKVTHEIDWSAADLPAKRNESKWDERRAIKWLARDIGAEHVQLAIDRFKRAVKRGT